MTTIIPSFDPSCERIRLLLAVRLGNDQLDMVVENLKKSFLGPFSSSFFIFFELIKFVLEDL